MSGIFVNRCVTNIETHTGLYLDLANPKPEQISIRDLARGLSQVCRFGAQTNRFYSVAEHSVRCSLHAPVGYRLAALLHDAHEAYIGDITAPMKFVLESAAPGIVKDLARRLDEAIAMALGVEVSSFKSLVVKDVDNLLLFREASSLKESQGTGVHWANDKPYEPLCAYGWSPRVAEVAFLDQYDHLSR